MRKREEGIPKGATSIGMATRGGEASANMTSGGEATTMATRGEATADNHARRSSRMWHWDEEK